MIKSTDLTGKACLLLSRDKLPDEWRSNGAQALRGVFEDAGYRTELVLCDTPKAINHQIAHHCEKGDVVAVGGGDGTINAVIDQVLESNVVLIPVPLGTANDFARTLSLPLDPVQATRAAVNGQLAMLDIGKVNGQSFVNAASIGVPADARKRINPDLKRRIGAISYAVANWQSWQDMTPLDLEITCGDQPAQRLKLRQLTVTNGRYFGGGLRPSDTKRPDDGLLHMFAIRDSVDTLNGMDIAAELLFGSIDDSQYALSMQCRDIHITGHDGAPILADGEIISNLPATFTLHPAGLPVFAPNTFFAEAASPGPDRAKADRSEAETDAADNRQNLRQPERINDIALDAQDFALRLHAIYPVAQSQNLKAICHDRGHELRDINRRLELALRPYGLPNSSPDPDLHSLEDLRDRVIIWLLDDADQRLAAGLKSRCDALIGLIAQCPTDDLPDDIARPLKALARLMRDLRDDLN